MSRIPARLRRSVVRRADNRCEYCGLAQTGQEATFHIDHIVPVVKGGETVSENLALACVSCSLRKAARTTARDPDSGMEVSLFNPRTDKWNEHFVWVGVDLIGLTDIGRGTIVALSLNRSVAQAIRAEERELGRHP